MVKLITRQEIAKHSKVVGSELTNMQKTFFDDDMLQFYKDDNEEQLYWEMFDLLNNEVVEYNGHHKIIGLSHSDINTFTTELTIKLTELFKAINANEFYIISHLKRDFFGNRDNKFKPLVNSYKKLEKIVGNTTYKEGFEFDISSLPDFIEILFWTTRCDPSIAEYIFLFDKHERTQIHLCKYGNIHLTEFGNEELTNDLLTSLGWTIIEGQEHDNFSTNGKIKGREIKI